MLRRQSLIALGVAIVLGLLAVYFANIFLSRTEQRAEAAEVGTAKVAVAAVPLEYGMPVTPEKVRFVDYPANSIPAGAFANINELLPNGQRRVAIRPMETNEPILASKLMGEGLSASIAALLPDGMRAATVRINDVSGVAGFIAPNNSVDVLITRQMEEGGRGRQITDVLLQNIKVLAIGQNAKDEDGKPTLAKTATLQVTPTDAQKLALAQQIGSLSLVLRKPGEEQNNPLIETVSLNDLRYGIYSGGRYMPVASTPRPRATPARAPARPARPRPAVAAPPQPSTTNVQVVRGTEGSSYEVGEYGS